MSVNVPTGDESTDLKKEEEIDPRCIVKFRPADDWEGEYGFDWFREGDYGELTVDNKRNDHTIVIYDNEGNPIPVSVKSKRDYNKENLVGRYYGDIILCDNEQLKRLMHKDEFKDMSGAPLYWAISDIKKYFFYSKTVCSHCSKNADCRYRPSIEYPWINEKTKKPYTVDPDFDKYLLRPSLLEQDKPDLSGDSGHKYYEKEFVKRYTPIQINSNPTMDYFVPTISLFYRNEIKEAENKWGKSSATIKLLISGENIDADIKNIDFEFECSIGIELLDIISTASYKIYNMDNECEGGTQLVDRLTGKPTNKIDGASPSIKKNLSLNYYEKNIKIILNEDFASFSVNEGDGVVKIYATNRASGKRFLAGKMAVEKCIPRKVDVLFVPIPVKIGSTVSIVRSKITHQHELLKRFLNQANIVPNCLTLNCMKDGRIKEEKLNKIIKKHKHYEKSDKGVLVDLWLDNKVVESLDSLFKDKYPEYANYYKVFIFGVKGDVNGRALDINSKSAVVFITSNDSTVCHELTHCFGLWHSFSNESEYTLMKYETSNIMDYQNILKRTSFCKWQWELIRKADGMKYENMDIIKSEWSLMA